MRTGLQRQDKNDDRGCDCVDVPVIPAIQGDSPQTGGGETVVPVLESSSAQRCASTCAGCVFTYIRCARGTRSFTSLYDYELRHVLQSEGLQRDLALWSSGLFPFFEYASTAVKVRPISSLTLNIVLNVYLSPLSSTSSIHITCPCKWVSDQ